jgi:glucosamine 6-phosphate synthetase-like amidotransferase/phosphosugar isomerase protein
LKDTYLPEHSNIVDSSIIPALMLHFEGEIKGDTQSQKEINIISHVLSMLEGTFGVWVANLATLNVYIARQGSTLFFDKNSFTSSKGQGYKEVKEGIIYKFNKKGFKQVGEFKLKSPFLEL